MQPQVEGTRLQWPAADRRRHPRYRWSEPVWVCVSSGPGVRGMSIELSETGMSALLSESLRLGEIVKIAPVAGGKASAVVRRHNGKIYGFEFLNLTWPQVREIARTCDNLPLYDPRTLNI